MTDTRPPRPKPARSTRKETRFPPGPLLRVIGDLDDEGASLDRARCVPGARVVFVNHEVLQHDFPSLADDALLRGRGTLRRLPRAARRDELRRLREDWLLAHAGIISTTQAEQTITNTRVGVAGKVREVWRPAGYGRACVVSLGATRHDDEGSGCGLIDVKGTGVAQGRTPSLQHHSSGLCTLGEVLREFLFQSLIDELFARAAPWFWTLPVYGVIDPGFDARTRRGGTLPAGLLVRRAHRRPPGGIQLPRLGSAHERTQVAVELLIRHYGLTSANRGTRFRFEEAAGGPRVFYAGDAMAGLTGDDLKFIARQLRGAALPLECDGINIQMTREIAGRGRVRAQLLDFDNFEARGRFREPLVSLVCDRTIRWGAVVWPGAPGFVQPSPALAVSEAKWGFGRLPSGNSTRPRRAEGEGPYLLTHDLAERFRSGEASGEQVRAELDRFVSDSIAHW